MRRKTLRPLVSIFKLVFHQEFHCILCLWYSTHFCPHKGSQQMVLTVSGVLSSPETMDDKESTLREKIFHVCKILTFSVFES